MNAINPADGLHRIKRQFQKRYMGQQCEALVRSVDDAIDATVCAAPIRTGRLRYLIARQPGTKPVHAEAQLERALFARWGPHAGPSCRPLEGCWYRIASFQISLANQRRADDWGEIDLIGVSERGLPIVIELKQGKATETPAASLVQAVSYALVLRKAWPTLRLEWQEFLAQQFDLRPTLPAALYEVDVVCAAPHQYWDEWIGNSPRARTVSRTAWDAFANLRRAFSKRGLNSTFVSIDDTNLSDPQPSVITVPPRCSP